MTPLQERIQTQLEAALLHHQRAEIEAPLARQGLASGGPDSPVIRLTIEDVARIAARTAEEIFATRHERRCT